MQIRPAHVGLLLTLVAAAATPLAAQVGTTTDIITGVVTGPDSQPLPDAIVQVTSVETQISRQRTTNARGRFTIAFPDGGGQYQLVVRSIGMAPARRMLARQSDEDRLVVNVRMTSAAMTLEEITVRGRAPRGNPDRPGPGARERNLNPDVMARLPIDAADLNVLATLAPGVVALGATDSTNAAFSVAGQRPTANNITLDGLSFGSGSVPQDAIRSTRVVTSTYDVARGQFSGGLVASTTRSGTNIPQGSFTYTLRDRSLAWGGATASAFGQGFTQQQAGGGFGGPIVRDRLFVFGALQGRWRDQGLTSLTSADPAALARLGVSPDSAARFLSLVGLTGVPMVPADFGGDRATDDAQALIRIDWKPTDAQTITLRLDGRHTSQDPTRVSPLSVPATGGSRSEHGGGVMGAITSYFGGNFINESRAYLSGSSRDAVGYLTLPEGRVQVASVLANGAAGVTTLAFGSSPGFPQHSDTRGLEFTDELSWLPGSAAHRIKLGTYLNGTHVHDDQTINQLGTFVFPSLNALAAGEPSSFTRTLSPLEQAGTAWNSALYVGDTWRIGDGFQIAYGTRLEGSSFHGAPPLNPALNSAFGIRTDRIPTDLHLSPRVGFTWTVGAGSGQPASTVVRGGIGDFRSPTPTSLYASALAAPGRSNAQAQLVCIGAAVPTPDWATYAQQPSAIPAACADTVTTLTITPHPNATVFDPGYAAPHAWRASLGWQRRILGTFALSVDASYARGVSQYGFRDLNLRTTPTFTLADEANRAVYVPAASIVPATGALSSADSRLDPRFGQVLSISSNLQSDTKQVTVGLGGVTPRGGAFQLSYTFTRARDQSSFSCCAAAQGFGAPSTGGDPNTPEWATSDFERRHSFLATVTYPVTAAFEITTIGRLNSGAPFTPIVASDINGDGARNDRAFVFDPATAPDAAVASAMRALLAGAPANARDCLGRQLGTLAARNSCNGPWQPSLDFQINWRPSWLGLDHRLTLSLVTVNLVSVTGIADPSLLFVRGFDPVADRFLYAVNGRFGTSVGPSGAVSVPFQIGLQARLTLGPDRTRGRLRTAFGGGRQAGAPSPFGAGVGAGSPDAAARFSNVVPNPIARILDLRDSLHLSQDQVGSLQAISDTLDQANRAIADSVQTEIEKAGARPDPAVLFARLRPKLAEGREKAREALERARAELTPEQWNWLPDAVKSPRRRLPPRN